MRYLKKFEEMDYKSTRKDALDRLKNPSKEDADWFKNQVDQFNIEKRDIEVSGVDDDERFDNDEEFDYHDDIIIKKDNDERNGIINNLKNMKLKEEIPKNKRLRKKILLNGDPLNKSDRDWYNKNIVKI